MSESDEAANYGDVPYPEGELARVEPPLTKDLSRLAESSRQISAAIFEVHLPTLRSELHQYREEMLKFAPRDQNHVEHFADLVELTHRGQAIRDLYKAWSTLKSSNTAAVGRAAWTLSLSLSAYESCVQDVIDQWQVIPDPPCPDNDAHRSPEDQAPCEPDEAQTALRDYQEAHAAHLLDHDVKEALISFCEQVSSAMESLASELAPFVDSGASQLGTPRDFGVTRGERPIPARTLDGPELDDEQALKTLHRALSEVQSEVVLPAFSALSIPLTATCQKLAGLCSQDRYGALAKQASQLEELRAALEGQDHTGALVDLIVELPWTLDAINTSLVEWSAEPDYPWRGFTRQVRSMSKLCEEASKCAESVLDLGDDERFTSLKENLDVLRVKLDQTLSAMRVKIGTNRARGRRSAAAPPSQALPPRPGSPDDQGSSSGAGRVTGDPDPETQSLGGDLTGQAPQEPPSIDTLKEWLGWTVPDRFVTLPGAGDTGRDITEHLPNVSVDLGKFVTIVADELINSLHELNSVRDDLSKDIAAGADVKANAFRAEQSLMSLMDLIKEHVSAALDSMSKHAAKTMDGHRRTDTKQLRRPDGVLLVIQFLLRQFMGIASEMQQMIQWHLVNPWKIDFGSHFDAIQEGHRGLSEQLQRYEPLLRPTDEKLDSIWEANRAEILDVLRRVRHGQQVAPLKVTASTGKHPYTIIGEHSASWRLSCDWTGELHVSKAHTHPKIRGFFRKVPILGRAAGLGHVTLQNATSREGAARICAEIQQHAHVRATCA